jgi:hypothetical protein
MPQPRSYVPATVLRQLFVDERWSHFETNKRKDTLGRFECRENFRFVRGILFSGVVGLLEGKLLAARFFHGEKNLSIFTSSFEIFLNFVLIEFQNQAVGRHLEVQLAVIEPQIDVPFSIG